MPFDYCLFDKNESESGIVIISYILPRKDKAKYTNDWSSSSISQMKRCKTNICKGAGTYFGSLD